MGEKKGVTAHKPYGFDSSAMWWKKLGGPPAIFLFDILQVCVIRYDACAGS